MIDDLIPLVKGADGTSRALLGSNQGHPGAVLYDASGNALLGRKAEGAGVPVTLSTEDLAKLETIRALLAAALPAGTNVIGKTGIDQTTPGTTNLVRAGSGATDDGAAAGEVYPGAGVYQAAADEVDDGDVGRLRISKRRAAVVAPDYRTLTLTNASPVPAGSDITNLAGGAVVGSDLQIRSTTTVYLLVPMAGWRDVLIEYYANPAYDQALTLLVYAHIGSTLGATLLSISVPTTAARIAIASAGASGVGGLAGGATAANGSYYTVPALGAPWSHIAIYLAAGVAPTAGSHTFYIRRRA